MTRSIVVTGANRGIGRALVAAILQHAPDTHVWLGARQAVRGAECKSALVDQQPSWANRIDVLVLDVTHQASVDHAADRVAEVLAGRRLYGLVNNAGVYGDASSIRHVVDVNTRGPERVCRAFLPLLARPGGRVVNMASASGPVFVAACAPERQQQLTDRGGDWCDNSKALEAVVSMVESGGDVAADGWGSGAAYGLSKAFLNTLTLDLARRNPDLLVNSCTPGFIETELTRPFARDSGQTPQEMGMLPPEAGTASTLHLLFSSTCGSGNYFGSDARRSPLDRYRAPGSPAYDGD